MLIKNGIVFTEDARFEPMTVLAENGRITTLLPADAMIKYSGEVIDAQGCYVLPGLTDIHFHGCAGHDICEGTGEAFRAVTEYEFSQGVTSVCPATMTLPDERLSGILRAAARFRKTQPVSGCAELVGIHLEGPFISRAKKGAQNEAFIQKPSAGKLRKWQADAEGLIRIVTIAPELDGAVECIGECRREMRFSLGHTESGYDTAMNAFRAGADHITHTFNAMPPFSHREPGVIGAAFDTEECFAEVICDGVHVSGSAVRALFTLFGAGRMVLISDSMEAAGMPDGEYQLGGQQVFVSGSRAQLADGTIAGSVTPLYKCMLTAVKMGIPLESVVRAATINPCRAIGIDDSFGSITVGKKAHFLLLERETLAIRRVIR